MKTTLDYFCEAMGWQGGTIHQARERFAIEDMPTMDRVCGVLVDNIRNISDPDKALWFTRHRASAAALHVRGLSK